jgi:hypothetical protein
MTHAEHQEVLGQRIKPNQMLCKHVFFSERSAESVSVDWLRDGRSLETSVSCWTPARLRKMFDASPLSRNAPRYTLPNRAVERRLRPHIKTVAEQILSLTCRMLLALCTQSSYD